MIDLDGQMLLPGFIDTHNHLFEALAEPSGSCLLDPQATLEEQRPFLRACQGSAAPGEWIIGHGHQLHALLVEPGENPRRLLDQLFRENPIVIMEESSHSMLVNSLALAQAGFDERSPHPPGGRLMRDPETKLLNGVLFDNAGDIVMELATNSNPERDRVSYEGLLAGLEEVAANGITTVGDGRLYWRRGWYEVWRRALANAELTVRVSARPWIYPELEPADQLPALRRMHRDDLDSLLIVNQVKLYSDGVMHFGTAKLLSPYRKRWHDEVPHGLNYTAPDALQHWLRELDKIGYGAHIHAVGDGAVRESLDAIAAARAADSDRISSLTHLELIDPTDFSRFRALGVHADFQAGASFFEQNREAASYVGPKSAKRMTPMRQLHNAGANITFSSDWTVNPLNPLVAIANSLRLKQDKGLPNIDEAIRAATINGAKALGLAAITGSVEPGKSADFVVLEQDIRNLSPKQIRRTEVTMTILHGEQVFEGP